MRCSGPSLGNDIASTLLGGRGNVPVGFGAVHYGIAHPFRAIPAFVVGPPLVGVEIRFLVRRKTFDLLLGHANFKVVAMLG